MNKVTQKSEVVITTSFNEFRGLVVTTRHTSDVGCFPESRSYYTQFEYKEIFAIIVVWCLLLDTLILGSKLYLVVSIK